MKRVQSTYTKGAALVLRVWLGSKRDKVNNEHG
ncbi:hypothetical protein QFZ86_001132 [Pseudomonas plecoglossicida]